MSKTVTVLHVKFSPISANRDVLIVKRLELDPDDLDAMQALVDGYIERVTCKDLGLEVWVNEEGSLRGLPLHHTPFYFQPLAGDFFISGRDLSSLREQDFAALAALGVES